MIFVTLGTNEAAFDRLVEAVAALTGRGEEVIVQHGSSAVRPNGAMCIDFLPFDELVELVRKARVVVSHAGVGSIMVVLSQGKRPVVVPRLRKFGEAVDDHQLPFARRLAERGLVTLVEDETRLRTAIDEADGSAALEGDDGLGLASELGQHLRSLVDAAAGIGDERRHSR